LRARLLAAGVLAAIAFFLYISTLLPGQDLGDTASFQAIAGDHLLVPRQAYPLYFALSGLLVHVLPVEAARAANLGSAVAAALAVGLVVLVGAELAGSLLAGLVAGLLLAGSYTFWSQAIIAEVYALHLLAATACLLALLAWKARPSTPRLALFFALCALGFGNHLSMVLLLPGFALLLVTSAPGGPLSMLRPRVVLLAAAIAALFALQYAWNVRWLVAEHPDATFADLARTFWFDVTKSDWRANMVYGIPTSTLADRFAMYWFDVRQQFGIAGAVAATLGSAALLWRQRRVGAMLLTLWFVNWVFAFTYNVGDVHVFYLGSHWAAALAAGCGAGWVVSTLTARRRKTAAAVAALALLAYPAWRAFDTYPAMDRSEDYEPRLVFDHLIAGMDTGREVLGRDLNWQLHNGLDYYVKHTRPDLAMFELPDALLSFPFLVSENAALGRTVLLTDGAGAMVRQLYGGLYDLERDPRVSAPSMAERVTSLPPGTPYVLSVIEEYPEAPINRSDLAEAAKRLGIGEADMPEGRFAIVAGRVGDAPVVRRSASKPFRLRFDLDGHRMDVRIECWMPADTIRRMGFGHVIVDRHHELTLDRGVSFAALDGAGRASLRAWASGLLAPQPRFIVRPRG
jgi:4-amino-4-deoxy-L-arabinose transferase-like glycosyltransferase